MDTQNLEEPVVHYGNESIYGSVPSNGRVHHCRVSFDGRRMCDCRGYYFHGSCSHLVELVEDIPSQNAREALLNALDIDPENPNMTTQEHNLTIKTTTEPFNRMMSPTDDPSHPMGGIPKKTGIGISGRPEAGKTTLSFQLGHEVMRVKGEGSNILLFDTEGSIHTYHGWADTFRNRYGLDTSLTSVEPVVNNGEVKTMRMERDPDADHQIFIMDVRELEKILAIHGRPGRVDTEDGKMKIQPNGPHVSDIGDAPIGQFVFQNNIDYIAYDSITNPLEQFTNRQQDRPTRAKATAWWMLQAQALAEERDMVQAYITHLSKNPTNPYSRPDVLGGKNIKHQIKYSIYMRHDSDNERELKLFRHPAKEPWEDSWYMDLQTGKGFVDIDS